MDLQAISTWHHSFPLAITTSTLVSYAMYVVIDETKFGYPSCTLRLSCVYKLWSGT